MEFHIRKAVVADAAFIARVHMTSWETTYRGFVPDEYLDSLNMEDRIKMWSEQLAVTDPMIFVAENPQEVFGFIGGGRLREPIAAYDGELYAVYLLREGQRCGVGRALMHTLADTLHTRNLNSMAVWVLEANPAVSFYKALGGVSIAQRTIEIGGASLPERAFGWPDLDSFGMETLAAKDSAV